MHWWCTYQILSTGPPGMVNLMPGAPKPCPVSQRAAVRSDLREEAQIAGRVFIGKKQSLSNSSGEQWNSWHALGWNYVREASCTFHGSQDGHRSIISIENNFSVMLFSYTSGWQQSTGGYTESSLSEWTCHKERQFMRAAWFIANCIKYQITNATLLVPWMPLS